MFYECVDISKLNVWGLMALCVGFVTICVFLAFIVYFILLWINSDFEDWRKKK